MESSVKAVSRPVIDRLPVNVNQLDDFACRQLDRVRSSSSFCFFTSVPALDHNDVTLARDNLRFVDITLGRSMLSFSFFEQLLEVTLCSLVSGMRRRTSPRSCTIFAHICIWEPLSVLNRHRDE
jgi:hypothetical protein